jgi:fatty-acyl-CoA synthase
MTKVSITELTPSIMLERSADVFGSKPAIVYGDRTLTYDDFRDLTTRTARALMASGVGEGDRVAYLMPNLPEMLIAHFAVPLIPAVLVAINTRLSGPEIEYILDHSGASILVVDSALFPVIADHLEGRPDLREVVVSHDPASRADPVDGHTAFEDFIARGSLEPLAFTVDDEERTISINYTSGTTGRPKGVMYSHRGGYLNAIAELIHSNHVPESVYLWTLPMFHCNGWCTTWAVTAIGGTHVCLRAPEPGAIWKAIRAHGVTHLNAAPTVLVSMVNHSEAGTLPRRDGHPFVVTTAGAPPSPTIIAQMNELGAKMVHVYGLTETYGPYSICEPQPGWADAPLEERVKLLARQGVAFIGADPIRVVDDDLNDVPRDGTTMGEVVMRGNNVMKGYHADPEATERAFRGGWFHSGDLGVWHPDGYIELRDRSKDIIISGGENISTIEVEQAVVSHDAVLEAAVVAMPDEHWGERPIAYVTLKPGATVEPEEIIAHVRDRLAHYKAPDIVEIVDQLPKTSTGKIQKYVLREPLWENRETRIN